MGSLDRLDLELLILILYAIIILLFYIRGDRYDDKMFNRVINCTIIGIVIITCTIVLTSIACR